MIVYIKTTTAKFVILISNRLILVYASLRQAGSCNLLKFWDNKKKKSNKKLYMACQKHIGKCGIGYQTILKNFVRFTRKYLCWSLFFIKLQAWSCNFLKTNTQARELSCKFYKNFKKKWLLYLLPRYVKDVLKRN